MPKKSPAKPLDRERALAKSANAILFKRSKLNCAPVSSTQISDVLAATKSQQLSRKIATTQKLLTAYAQNDVPITKLPAKTREFLTAVADKSANHAAKNKRVYKSWPRKNAAILVALMTERKPRAAKPKPVVAESTPAPAAE